MSTLAAWTTIVATALKLMSWTTRWFHRQELIEAAQAEIIAQSLQEASAIVAKAMHARDAQLDADRRDPSRMRNDEDPFRRD